MWAIKFLSGPLAGSSVIMQKDQYTIGRNPDCDLQINSNGISKNHCRLVVTNEEVIIEDLNSRNGTFIDGKKISRAKIEPGQKISINQSLMEVISINENLIQMPYNQNTQTQNSSENEEAPEDSAEKSPEHLSIPEKLKLYIDRVAMPGVYKLTEIIEIKWLLIIMTGLFVTLVTALATVPMTRILKNSVQVESQRRALTISRTLAQMNRQALIQGLESSTSVSYATKEQGVKKAYIISDNDGSVLAPSSEAGRFPDIKFAHTARKLGQESVQQIDGSTIGALTPISYFDSASGTQRAKAHAVVIYDMKSLAVGGKEVVSLFVQTLFLALILGGIFCFLIYKLFEFPIVALNLKTEHALQEGENSIDLEFLSPEVQKLTSTISSTLSRVSDSSEANAFEPEFDRNTEMSTLVQLIGFPAITVQTSDLSIASVNDAFVEKTGTPESELLFHSISDVTDVSLKLSLEDLVEKVAMDSSQMHVNELEFSGVNHEIIGTSIYGKSEIAYYVFVILPADGGDE